MPMSPLAALSMSNLVWGTIRLDYYSNSINGNVVNAFATSNTAQKKFELFSNLEVSMQGFGVDFKVLSEEYNNLLILRALGNKNAA